MLHIAEMLLVNAVSFVEDVEDLAAKRSVARAFERRGSTVPLFTQGDTLACGHDSCGSLQCARMRNPYSMAHARIAVA